MKNEEEKKEKRTNFKTAVLFIVIDHINAEDNMIFFLYNGCRHCLLQLSYGQAVVMKVAEKLRIQLAQRLC